MSRAHKPNIKKLQAECDGFNAVCALGGAVSVELDSAVTPFITITTSEAQVLSGHSAVVWLKGISGCYSLDKVTALPTPQ